MVRGLLSVNVCHCQSASFMPPIRQGMKELCQNHATSRIIMSPPQIGHIHNFNPRLSSIIIYPPRHHVHLLPYLSPIHLGGRGSGRWGETGEAGREVGLGVFGAGGGRVGQLKGGPACLPQVCLLSTPQVAEESPLLPVVGITALSPPATLSHCPISHPTQRLHPKRPKKFHPHRMNQV